jgi:Protein of unknown function (DUF1254)
MAEPIGLRPCGTLAARRAHTNWGAACSASIRGRNGRPCRFGCWRMSHCARCPPDRDQVTHRAAIFDMWTNVFASPGWRTMGTQAGHFAIVPPRWQPGQSKLPEGRSADRCPHPLCLDHRPHQGGRPTGLRCCPQDSGGPQDHAAVALGQGARTGRSQDLAFGDRLSANRY